MTSERLNTSDPSCLSGLFANVLRTPHNALLSPPLDPIWIIGQAKDPLSPASSKKTLLHLELLQHILIQQLINQLHLLN